MSSDTKYSLSIENGMKTIFYHELNKVKPTLFTLFAKKRVFYHNVAVWFQYNF